MKQFEQMKDMMKMMNKMGGMGMKMPGMKQYLPCMLRDDNTRIR